MIEKRTLGEHKEAECHWCQTWFSKKRYDQRFCTPDCLQRSKRAERPVWATRPDRAEQNAKRNARYYANRERELQKQREWREAHPEETKAFWREFYQRNKQALDARTKAYREAHPETRKKEYANARLKRPWNGALTNARNRALKNGFAFDLTREWCEQRWTGYCELSKLPFQLGTQRHFPFSPSIDRIRNDQGYTQDNCRFILFAVNSFKGTATDEEVLRIAQAIVFASESCTA